MTGIERLLKDSERQFGIIAHNFIDVIDLLRYEQSNFLLRKCRVQENI